MAAAPCRALVGDGFDGARPDAEDGEGEMSPAMECGSDRGDDDNGRLLAFLTRLGG